MSQKKVIIIVSVLLVMVIGGGFLFYRIAPPFSKESGPPTAAEQASDLAELYPLTDPEKRDAYMKQPVSSWEEWVKARAEIGTAGFYARVTVPPTPEQYTKKYNKIYAGYTEIAERYKQQNYPVPTDATFSFFSRRDLYEGPQTPEAIMAKLDDRYENSFPQAAEMEKTYPRAQFLQRLLDKGAVVKGVSDYHYYMKLRGELLYRKERPKDWHSGNYGIPVTTDFAEYEVGFLERKVWESSIIQKVNEENPGRHVAVYFPASHPDVYLPVIGKMRYVHLSKNRDIIDSFGTNLTQGQLENLWHKGIEPKDIEIVYIDEDYNILSEPPPLVDKGMHAHNHRGTVHDVNLTPENYESVVGHPASAEWLENYEKRQAQEMQDTAPDLEAIRAAAAREAAAAAHEAAKAEFEKFQNSMRHLENFATMSDTEIEKALEKQFRKQFLPEHPVEQLTPERLEKALGTLYQHGFEEGFRRIRQDTPALAAQLERYFGLERLQHPTEKSEKSERTASPVPSKTTPTEKREKK